MSPIPQSSLPNTTRSQATPLSPGGTQPAGTAGADLTIGKSGGAATPLLDVRDLKKHFPILKGLFSRVAGQVYAVDGVSFEIAPGETLGLVGESGCGKSTVGRTLLKLMEPTAGSIRVNGTDITALRRPRCCPTGSACR